MSQALEKLRRKPEATDGQDADDGDDRCGKEAPDAALVKSLERKFAAICLAENDPRDQIAGHDEKQVDANEAAAERRNVQMIEEYAQDGDRPEPVNVASMG
ncbi:hypothetical protein I6F21_26045 [Bradyrhizobium sp. NBAIM03]|uniref:hypothetical protein n=1 Tax=Bradyrhizobium sp. NBAIM03 TaxID=2793816 RepID=UPI0023EE3FAD|nr:hypothetical protein [Bradyrhizobium sp. NBAIM03]MCA1536002.1 hypothetical protein [Bradyrhizobium sp. NBAIM03]